jgi:hypothetical protein
MRTIIIRQCENGHTVEVQGPHEPANFIAADPVELYGLLRRLLPMEEIGHAEAARANGSRFGCLASEPDARKVNPATETDEPVDWSRVERPPTPLEVAVRQLRETRAARHKFAALFKEADQQLEHICEKLRYLDSAVDEAEKAVLHYARQ